MRELLINTMVPVLWTMTAFDAVAIYFMLKEFKTGRVDRIPLLTGILCLGLFYDSLILAGGCFLQYGTLFHHLSQLRYILHCTLIPLLFPICAYSLTENKTIVRIIWIFALIVMVLGLAGGLAVVTEPRTVGMIRRYASSDLTGKFSSTLT
ncbi:MAG: hypothetical protein IJI77_07410, partial [Erysipelotrichaceae bacterium]|nr:hypothetical protein [Erysipelotrichaceae bacterium]